MAVGRQGKPAKWPKRLPLTRKMRRTFRLPWAQELYRHRKTQGKRPLAVVEGPMGDPFRRSGFAGIMSHPNLLRKGIRMRFRVRSLWVGFLLLASCSTAQVSYDQDANFTAYKTFAQAPAPRSAPNLVGYSSIVGNQIQDEIAAQLKAKGFRAADPANADLMVVTSISGQQRADVVSDAYTLYGDAYTVRYVEGTLIIDIFDHAKKRLLFHGWDQKQIFSSNAQAKEATQAVQEILKKFPPKPKG